MGLAQFYSSIIFDMLSKKFFIHNYHILNLEIYAFIEIQKECHNWVLLRKLLGKLQNHIYLI